MAVGFFLEKDHKPSSKEIQQIVGKRWVLFRMLMDFMRGQYQMKGEWSFGGKNYGWNYWYRKSGKTLLNLFPQKDYFVAQVVLGKQQVEAASALSLGKNVACVFSRAPQFHDGRWLYIPVKSKRDATDVLKLICLKKKLNPKVTTQVG